MSDIWSDISRLFTDATVRNGMQFSLFLMSLFYLFFFEKNRKRANFFCLYVLFCMVIFFFPISFYLILRFAIDIGSIHRLFWILPNLILIAYVFVNMEEKIVKKVHHLVYLSGVVVVLMFAAPSSVTLVTDASENLYQLPDAVIEVIDKINEDATEHEIERKKVLFPIHFVPLVRQYDASIYMPFGTSAAHMWSRGDYLEGNVLRLFRATDREEINWVTLGRLMREEEINYFVIRSDIFGLNALGNGFNRIGEVGRYSVFRTDSFAIYPTTFEGINYEPIYDFEFFINRYEHVREMYGEDPEGALRYFVSDGIPMGLQGNAAFCVEYYILNYEDLAAEFQDNMEAYYYHYLDIGIEEGRIAFARLSIYDGLDYSAVFRFEFFLEKYPEMKERFADDFDGALSYFINYGMDKAMQGSPEFNPEFYRRRYFDLDLAFGDDWRRYYMHFIRLGIDERRIGNEVPRF